MLSWNSFAFSRILIDHNAIVKLRICFDVQLTSSPQTQLQFYRFASMTLRSRWKSCTFADYLWFIYLIDHVLPLTFQTLHTFLSLDSYLLMIGSQLYFGAFTVAVLHSHPLWSAHLTICLGNQTSLLWRAAFFCFKMMLQEVACVYHSLIIISFYYQFSIRRFYEDCL